MSLASTIVSGVSSTVSRIGVPTRVVGLDRERARLERVLVLPLRDVRRAVGVGGDQGAVDVEADRGGRRAPSAAVVTRATMRTVPGRPVRPSGEVI